MDPTVQLLTSLGISTPAGFNAYLSLLLVGLGGRFGWITLSSPYDFLQSVPVLVVLAALLTVEVVADKIPALDSVNDLIGTLVRPASGAVLFAAGNHVLTDPAPIASYILGGLAAGGLHAFKAGTRPVWTASTAGLANPVVSVFEDLFAGTVVILGMLAPVIAVLVLFLVLGLAVFLIVRLRRGLRRRLGPAR
ncbi:MAG: DUF4126 domain-containing protein [Chloroflexota bacterium]|nr:DUF4126 domain-containing protein [Chloroflexota bacterium]